MAYMQAVEDGTFVNDESSLLDVIDPVDEALNLCDRDLIVQIGKNMQSRNDYLNDINFLHYLKSK